MPKVFISHSSADREFVRRELVGLLEGHGLQVWYSEEHINSATDWERCIKKALEECDWFLVVLSRHALESDWVKTETHWACENRKGRIVPVLVERVNPADLHLKLAPIEYVDYGSDREAARKKLLATWDIAHAGEAPGAARSRRRMRVALASAAVALVAAVLLGLYLWRPAREEPPDVRPLLAGHRWISYDPAGFDPVRGIDPSPDNIDRELGWIREAGFDGLVTFTMRDAFAKIPEMAKRRGFAVIAGVWDPRDAREMKFALENSQSVDAWCVGHDGLDRIYSWDDLSRAMRELRRRTSKAVSTTEAIGRYTTDSRLLGAGDWLFPDAHVSVRSEGSAPFLADALRDAHKTIDMGRALAVRKELAGRPVLLKMINYPMAGVSNASLDEQAQFFISLLDSRRDAVPDLPLDVSVSVHSAFDSPWKKGWPFYPWADCTGLLDNTGRPRPAVAEIIKRLP